jgi:hypothetical protein
MKRKEKRRAGIERGEKAIKMSRGERISLLWSQSAV